MIDFKNTTYFVRRTEKDEVIKILKKHSEYRGFDDKHVFKNKGLEQENYYLLWEQIDKIFKDYRGSNTIYLDNRYITKLKIWRHPWLVGLAEVYTNDYYVRRNLQPLLPELKKIDKPLMKVE